MDKPAILRLVSGQVKRLDWPVTGHLHILHVVIGLLALIALLLLLPLPHASSKSASALAGGPVSVIEDSPSFSLYSNGLRVENGYRTAVTQRFYQTLDRSHDLQPSATWYSEPVGIVFHMTETGADGSDTLLSGIRQRAAYHFVIDRAGRTWRVVDPLDVANHSGNSVWANGDLVYLNLNNSFLGVAFEALTPEGSAPELTPEQRRAGRLLTQLLRSQFHIPFENCVTHAQVSVNPDNLRAGYHTDGARGFPFVEFGLPDNYELPVVAISDFGFRYDELYLNAMGGSPWKGLESAERTLLANAKRSHVDPDEYRRFLQARYRHLFGSFKLTGAMDEP